MKHWTAMLLTLALALSLTACGSEPQEPVTQATPDAEEPEVRVVTDVFGREVEIPAEVETIVCLGSAAPRYAAYLDVMDMVVGAEEHDQKELNVRRDYNPVYFEQFQTLPIVGAGGGSGQNNGYPEELITLAPDVILAGFDPEPADELQRQTGIPVVSIRNRDNGFIDENFNNALEVFAEVVGAEERCQEVLDFVADTKQDLWDRTKDIPEADKPRAYTGAVTFNGRHGFAGTYVNFGPFLGVNALNVADELARQQVGDAADAAAESGTAYLGNNGLDVDLEQIVAWDPDVIFLDPGNMDLVNDEYANNPAYFDSLRAVQNGQVYTMPALNNCGPNFTYALIDAYFAGMTLYPEQFSDVNLEEKAGEILEFMLGENTFDQMAEGGLYYGPITLGA